MAAYPVESPTQCPKCRAKLRTYRPRCPRCRTPLRTTQGAADESRRGASGWSVVGASALILFGFVVFWPDAKSAATPIGTSGGSRAVPASRSTTASVAPQTTVHLIPHPTDAAWRGAEAFRRGDYEAALTAYAMAISVQPDNTEALSNAALALERLGRFDEALPLLERAIQLAPEKWSYRFNLGHVLGRMGDWAGAVEAYREADRLFSDDYVTLFNLGLALQRLGSDEEAIGPLARACELEPTDASLLLPLARSYQRLGRWHELRQTLARYLQLAPDSPMAPTARNVLQKLDSSAAEASR